MRKIGLILFSAATFALASCEATKSTATQTSTVERETSSGRNTSGTNRSVSHADSKTDAKKKEIEQAREMYREIGMSSEQIERYERFTKGAGTSNRGRSNQGSNEYERIEQQDKIMREILDDQQFKRYQDWVLKQSRTRN